MPALLIEPHYLGSLEYFVLLSRHNHVRLEVTAHFTKQSYKNRFELLTTQGPQALSIPVKFGNRTPFKDVRIDHSQNWVREHWGALFSAYGKAPFFEFFADHFRAIWEKNHEFLVDLNMDFLTLCLKLLQLDITFDLTSKFEAREENDVQDYREVIHPKKTHLNRNIYKDQAYSQNFGNEFVPNLSIVDLLFSQGSASLDTLRKSDFEQ